ncbi:putative 6-phospho-beta-glucosidase [Halolactibacillus miurensis]|uniref:6-phospho-beta-glucosidase n=1 Tax=Halolactibacillus miurensis TaxID=306541 RepID=A0A1I6UPK8_9BACI|nr:MULTISPECIES: 6-phospho-beta-glucosidase [Halolactibacillus]GEM05387.1 putative 6-phospho-beta-glucosidase [Halolactibacillus miurensis]SFT03343.1 6-phospho-beta-glucosidase [Halolactibacillus miurensis]
MKLVIIGGGSSYTPEIIEGLIKRHSSFPVSTIVLVDIDEGYDKMTIVGELAKRMIEAAGVPIALSWTTNRKEALKDAAFVSTQLRVGGLKAREKDERIPLSHGMIGQETNGAGGIFKAFRTIPVLLDIAEDIHDICPDAWMINFTNPAGIVTEALLKYSPHKKVIGVCNIPFNMQHSIAEVLEVDPSSVRIEFVGLNHFVYGKKVFVDGMDRTQEVLDRLIEQVVNYSPANIVSLGWTETFLKSLQLLPNPYHQYYYKQEAMLAKDLQSYEQNGTRSEVVQEVEHKLFELYKQPTLHEKPKELEDRGGAYYSDVACSLMSALYNDSHEIMTVNTLNQGAIRDLPLDSVVEVNCVITKSGPMPLATGALPEQIKGDILKMKAFEEQVIRASLSGDYEEAFLAFLLNPLVGDEDRAKVVLDELLIAHQAHLPQFN